eukprot:jgi/Mesvir1/8926/Mv25600-RA.1
MPHACMRSPPAWLAVTWPPISIPSMPPTCPLGIWGEILRCTPGIWCCEQKQRLQRVLAFGAETQSAGTRHRRYAGWQPHRWLKASCS